MGQLIEPRAWCRQRWCRKDEEAEHRPGDGCSCGPHGRVPAGDPRLIELTAKAAHLTAFACRSCGRNARKMVEYPLLFFRCEPCAAADRWPVFGRPHAGS
ncbi:MAG TPA: hypothetical protein VGL03_12430 [Thermoanaerobaculia bacterium]